MIKKIIGGVAVIEKDGKHLLVKQAKYKPMSGKWRHPGGTFEKGENALDCLMRELKEELDLRIRVLDEKPFHVEKIDYMPEYFAFYKAVIIDGKIKMDNQEVEEYGWFTLEEILCLDLMNATRSFYREKYSLQFE